jgi:hypothetical protein
MRQGQPRGGSIPPPAPQDKFSEVNMLPNEKPLASRGFLCVKRRGAIGRKAN